MDLMGLSLSSLVVSSGIGAVGYVLFHYGKKSARLPQLVSGLTLMVFPVFVPGLGWMLGLTALVLAGLWACLRAGL